MQTSGLEWLFRLATEPRRRWKRCLTTDPAFIWLALQQLWRTAPPATADIAAAPAATPGERRIA
jgi:N-acetylglucosaminyldiphosphoundecaprenol N-acetyl-beta-D-mannosaminyltransferase